MYPTKPGFLIGFHGCDKSLRDKIVNVKISLNPSKTCTTGLVAVFTFGKIIRNGQWSLPKNFKTIRVGTKL